MKIVVFGATGTIGQRIVSEAVRRGHQVTACARNVAMLKESSQIRPVQADILEPRTISKVIAGHDAVISSFSPMSASGNQPFTSLVMAARSLMAGMKQARVKRLLIVGGAGSLEAAPGTQLMDTPDFPAAWKPFAVAHGEALKTYRSEANELDWTYFSPAALIQPGERTGKFRLGYDQLISDASGESRISAEDFAVAAIDELENPRHIGKRFTIGY